VSDATKGGEEMQEKTWNVDLRLVAAMAAVGAAFVVAMWAGGAFAAGGSSGSSGSSNSPASDVPAWFTQAQDNQQQAPSDNCPEDGSGGGGGGGGGTDQGSGSGSSQL
jgi:hypothetical protein